MFLKKEIKQIKTNKPTLIIGLPGIANIARITTEFLIEELKAQKIREYYSHNFPPIIMITNDSTIRLPRIEAYHYKNGDEEIILITGDMQPIEEHAYEFCEQLIKDYKPKEIITIGGIGMNTKPTGHVHVVATNTNLTNQFKKYKKTVVDGNETVNIIVGTAGLMVGIGELHNVPGYSLLVETTTEPDYVGINEAITVLEILNKHKKLNLSLEKLKQEAEAYNDEMKKRKTEEDKILEYYFQTNQTNTNYIG